MRTLAKMVLEQGFDSNGEDPASSGVAPTHYIQKRKASQLVGTSRRYLLVADNDDNAEVIMKLRQISYRFSSRPDARNWCNARKVRR